MGTKENKELVRRYFTPPTPDIIREIQQAKDPKAGIEQFMRQAIEETFAPDCIAHFPEGDMNREGLINLNLVYLNAFPDASFVVDEMVAERDFVVVRVTMRGTNLGSFKGIPATGKKVKMGYMDMLRIAGRRIIEAWIYSDELGLMQQLGAVPSLDLK